MSNIFNTLLLPLRVVGGIVVTIIGASLGVIGGIIDPKHRLGIYFGARWWAPTVLWVLGARLKIFYKERVPMNTGQVYLCNHESLIDIPIAAWGAPHLLSFVGKQELKKVPFIGWAMMATDMIFIDRRNKEKAIQSIQEAGEKIRKGKAVILFPDGTRTRNGDVLPFKKGSFHLSIDNELDIIPMAIVGAYEVLPPDTIRVKPGKVALLFGHPITHETYSGLSADELSDLVRDTIISLREEGRTKWVNV
jgi:1-acyl-sn-glycerol-3-phosphate acyltransferase